MALSSVLTTASPAAAQSGALPRLRPTGAPVEVIDPSERISGNATTGLVFVRPDDRIGHDRLWAYLSAPVAPRLKLKISSIDGRYYAEVDYDAAGQAPGWVALDLTLSSFGFLEENYSDPLSEIAALLSDADSPRFYPVRWGGSHEAAAAPPPAPDDGDAVRVYLNTERASAFVVVANSPSYCRDASSVSGFKFNAVCDVTLGDLRAATEGERVVDTIEVFRRSGVRTLAPVTLDVSIKY
jgi:hypothetical protein